MYSIVFTTQSVKDSKKILSAGLKPQVEKLLEIIKINPFQNPPHYEKLVGELTGAYSRRINIQHRLVYQVYTKEKIIKVIRMWTHYYWNSLLTTQQYNCNETGRSLLEYTKKESHRGHRDHRDIRVH